MNRYSGKGIFRHLLLFCVLVVIFPNAILAQDTPNGAPTPEPMPTGPPDAYPPPVPPGNVIAPTPEGTRPPSSPGPHASSSSNRIVHHAATPAQLIKTGNGLQFYYIGADGSTASGPHFPSFSETGGNVSFWRLGLASERVQSAHWQACQCRLFAQ